MTPTFHAMATHENAAPAAEPPARACADCPAGHRARPRIACLP